MVRVLLPGMGSDQDGGTKIPQHPPDLSFQILPIIFRVGNNDIVGRGAILEGKRRPVIWFLIPSVLPEQVAQPTVGKAEEDNILLLQPQGGKHLLGFILALLAILAVVLGGGVRDVLLHLHPFRIAISARHKNDLDCPPHTQHALDQASGSESLIIRVRGKDHEAGVFREEHFERLWFLFRVGTRRKPEQENEEVSQRSFPLHNGRAFLLIDSALESWQDRSGSCRSYSCQV